MSGRKTGASVSSKQLAYTVKEGRMVTFQTVVGNVEGYLCGMDDYHWVVVTPELRQYLVHKVAAGLIHLHKRSTYAKEPLIESLEVLVAPFREAMARQFWSSQQP